MESVRRRRRAQRDGMRERAATATRGRTVQHRERRRIEGMHGGCDLQEGEEVEVVDDTAFAHAFRRAVVRHQLAAVGCEVKRILRMDVDLLPRTCGQQQQEQRERPESTEKGSCHVRAQR